MVEVNVFFLDSCADEEVGGYVVALGKCVAVAESCLRGKSCEVDVFDVVLDGVLGVEGFETIV